VLLSGCGAILTGTSTSINIVPSDTSSSGKVNMEVVTSNGIQKVQAPVIIKVPRANQSVVINVRDKCFRDTSTAIQPKFNLIAGLDIFSAYSATTATTVDIVSGAAWTYDDFISVPVTPNGTCK
jgi:hypothetical protein